MIEKVIEFTKNLKFFQSLREDHSEDLHYSVCSCMQYEYFPENSLIFKQGDTGSKFYIILEGKVRIFKEVDEETQEFGEFSIGDKFGERALKYGIPRAASVQCLTNCSFCVLEKSQFKQIFDKFFDKKFSLLTEMLKTLPIFKGHSNNFIQKLGYFFRSKKFLKGSVIYNEGDPANEIFFIQEGQFILSRKFTKSLGKDRKLLKAKKHNFSIQLACLTRFELFGDEEILSGLDFRINSCVCNSNEGTLFIASKETFLKSIIRNEDAYNVMKYRVEKKKEYRQLLFDKRLKLNAGTFEDLNTSPRIIEKCEKNPLSPVKLSPLMLKPVKKTSIKSSTTQKKMIYTNYKILKHFLEPPKERCRNLVVTPVNIHTAKLKLKRNLSDRRISKPYFLDIDQNFIRISSPNQIITKKLI